MREVQSEHKEGPISQGLHPWFESITKKPEVLSGFLLTALAAVIVIIFGIAADVDFGTVIQRFFIFSLVAFGIGYGLMFLLRQFKPEAFEKATSHQHNIDDYPTKEPSHEYIQKEMLPDIEKNYDASDHMNSPSPPYSPPPANMNKPVFTNTMENSKRNAMATDISGVTSAIQSKLNQ